MRACTHKHGRDGGMAGGSNRTQAVFNHHHEHQKRNIKHKNNTHKVQKHAPFPPSTLPPSRLCLFLLVFHVFCHRNTTVYLVGQKHDHNPRGRNQQTIYHSKELNHIYDEHGERSSLPRDHSTHNPTRQRRTLLLHLTFAAP